MNPLVCTKALHEAYIADSVLWGALRYIGTIRFETDETGPGYWLEHRNCNHCQSTLCKEIPLMTPTTDERFTDFDRDDTQDLPLPITDAKRYTDQYNAAASDDCTLTKWEHRSPGALSALRLWAASRHLSVLVRDCRSNASCMAYEVEIVPTLHTITVYVAEPRS